MRKLLLPLLLCLPFLACAQTYFYINTITVDPTAPTVNDVVTISLHGDLSSTGAYIVSSNANVFGTDVYVSIVAADPGGFTVLVPHTVNLTLGMLPAGTYTIVMDSTVGVWDMASQSEHVFVVSGSNSVPSLENDGLLVTTQYGQLSITATDGAALGQLDVLDAQGKVVLSTQVAAARFDAALGTNAPGVYVVRLAERGVLRKVLVE